eukprot:TRINITY_DN1349_c0_g3_i1.p1 TRINITY_DN1349_c0_g3~~TRINITY_DN1349_c0_g3_i1.p1  ORF type:complete len:432 (+),score=80.03 TRINITY_DN1349_c0_g3_i1:147-1442(+)
MTVSLTHWDRPAAVILFIAGLMTCVVLVVLLISKRNDTFVVKRGFWSSLLCAIGAATAFVGNAGPPTFEWNCLSSMTVNWIGGGMLMIFHLERCFMFYCEFIVAKEYQHLAHHNFGIQVGGVTGSLGRINNSLTSWILENRRYMRPELLSYPKLVGFSLLALWALIAFSLIYLLCAQSLDLNFYDGGCQKSVLTIWSLYQLRVLLVVFLAGLRRKLIQVEENVGFTEELNRQLTCSIATFAAWIYLFPGVSERLGLTVLLVYTSILDLFLLWTFCVSFERHFSFHQEKVQVTVRTSLNEDIASLIGILQDEGEVFREFEQFLRLRFSAENAYYWIAVEKVKRIEDHEEFLRGAYQVYQEFLAAASSIPLNLSSAVTEEIRSFCCEDLNALSPDQVRESWTRKLGAAQHEVLLLMVKGPYLDFRAMRAKTPK